MNNLKKTDGFENQYLFVFQREITNSFQSDPLFESFHITDIGYFPYAQNHYRVRDKGCKQGILLYCVAGSGYYRLGDNKPVDLHSGQAIVLPPDIPHEYAASEAAPWSMYWLHYSGSMAASLSDMLMQRQPLSVDSKTSDKIVNQFGNIFSILKLPCQREEYYAVCQYASSILAAISLAGKQIGLQLTVKGDQAIQDAILFMKQNLTHNLSLAEISSAANFSSSHLHTLFKSATNHSPISYFLNMKMQAASKELYFTDRSIKEIAADYGIFDSCYFSRIFKKIMGVSPNNYRRLKKG